MPIVIPVINEIGLANRAQQGGGQRPQSQQQSAGQQGQRHQQSQGPRPHDDHPPISAPVDRKFPPKQYPDTEAIEPVIHVGGHSY